MALKDGVVFIYGLLVELAGISVLESGSGQYTPSKSSRLYPAEGVSGKVISSSHSPFCARIMYEARTLVATRTAMLKRNIWILIAGKGRISQPKDFTTVAFGGNRMNLVASYRREARMQRWIGVSSIVIGLVAGLACNRRDEDRARSESREAQEKASKQLDEASRKLKEGLKRADEQTRQDLYKARDQLRHALTDSEKDAQKARDRLRDGSKDEDSHQ
jgi:hypothetical protein